MVSFYEYLIDTDNNNKFAFILVRSKKDGGDRNIDGDSMFELLELHAEGSRKDLAKLLMPYRNKWIITIRCVWDDTFTKVREVLIKDYNLGLLQDVNKNYVSIRLCEELDLPFDFDMNSKKTISGALNNSLAPKNDSGKGKWKTIEQNNSWHELSIVTQKALKELIKCGENI